MIPQGEDGYSPQNPPNRKSDRMIQDTDRTGGSQPRKASRLCSVVDCTSFGQGSPVPDVDEFGPPGLRCIRHGGGKKCSIEGCTVSSKGHVPDVDCFGLPGLRCQRHGGGNRCSVKGCATSS